MEEKTYAQKLQDPRWQRKRLEILGRDQFRCRKCFNDGNSLHVHHIAYNHGEPWDIDNELLITLCKKCHDQESIDVKTSLANLINSIKSSGYMSHEINLIAEIFTNASARKIGEPKILEIIWHIGTYRPAWEYCVASYSDEAKDVFKYLEEKFMEDGFPKEDNG